jgi:hypothetical protein
MQNLSLKNEWQLSKIGSVWGPKGEWGEEQERIKGGVNMVEVLHILVWK